MKDASTKSQKYAGPVVDTVSGMNSNTRRAWVKRAILEPDDEGFSLEQVFRACAGMELARHGVASATVRNYLLDVVAADMLAHVDDAPQAPRYVVACPMPDLNLNGPVARRMIQGGIIALADGDGALCIASGLSAGELAEHFASMDKAGDVATFAIDAAGLLRRTLARLAALTER